MTDVRQRANLRAAMVKRTGRAAAQRRGLARLRVLRNQYGAQAERDKRALLTQIGAQRLAAFEALRRWHDDLLFLCAFPGARATRTAALRELARFERRLRAAPAAQRRRADDSGMAGSVSRHVFPYGIVCWLTRAEGGRAAIDWSAFDDPAGLDAALESLLRGAEREAFASGEFGTRQWLARMWPGQGDPLRRLIRAGAAAGERFAAAWERAEVPIAWSLAGSPRSVTLNRLRGCRVVVRSSMRRPPADPVAHVAQPLPAIEPLPLRRARQVIEVARAALAARCREVHAFTHANPAEVYLADLGEGGALALFGVVPEQRLTLEANYGYMLLANGVPIGYGGVTPLHRQANTGINVFDPYRGSEAAFLWLQTLRAFATLFACRRFLINAYQFGAGNSEAIASGAYWFYYRLGFRPSSAPLARRAGREAERLRRSGARSSAATLKALAQGDLVLDLPGWNDHDAFDEAALPRLGAAAAARLGRVPAASRALAERRLAGEVAAALDAADWTRWPQAQRKAFAALAPVVALVPDLGDWTPEDKGAVRSLMRAKALPQEREFAQAAAAAQRLFAAWKAIR